MDLEQGVAQQESHDKSVIINGVNCKVEKCKQVIKELQDFATKFKSVNLSQLPKRNVGKEAEAPTEEPPKKRPRCVIYLGGASP